MTLLSNLLLHIPGHSGFSSYVKRVMHGIPGHRLILSDGGRAECRLDDQLPQQPPISKRLSLLHRLSLTQHGIDVHATLRRASIPVESVEAVYSPFCDTLFALPHVPQVITCHDLTPLYCSNSRKAAWRYRYWTPQHLRRATRVIAISRFVADQLIEMGVPASKLEVIHNGIAVQRPVIDKPCSLDLLMLARHDRNKNVLNAVRAFAHLLERRPGWSGRLVVVGRAGRETQALKRVLAGWPQADRVVLKSKVEESELVRLLRSSLALVSASHMEGYDYPVLEAKAEGLPTLISDIPVHREIHDQSSLFFSPDVNGDQFADLVIKLATDNDLWKQLSAAGHQLASHLTITSQQQKIRSVLNQLNLPWT